ncbi:MAG: DUF1269 domain-containing protein [Anaerolineae bacterium]|nr:DUF1269 domain-containing protein [Anaerolineae bacterium]
MSEEKQTNEGVGIVVAAFPEETSGEHALNVLKEAKKLKYIYFEDAALIRQDADGGVHYHETGDMSTGKGSGVGALIGGVIGILGGPAGIVLGAGAGAVVGGVVGHGDAGFKDENLEQLGVALKPATSAVAVTASNKFLHTVRKQVNDADMRTAVSTLSTQLAAHLEAGKNVALGLKLAESGLEIIEITVKDKVDDLIGVIAAKDGVLANTHIKEEPENFAIPGAATNPASGIIAPDHEGNY